MEKDELNPFLEVAMNQSDAEYKALAYYMFREVIEDAHTKYNISNEDMKEMCKMAVNRAKLYIDSMKSGDKAKQDAFLIYALYTLEWDDAEVTADIKKQCKLLKCSEEMLKGNI